MIFTHLPITCKRKLSLKKKRSGLEMMARLRQPKLLGLTEATTISFTTQVIVRIRVGGSSGDMASNRYRR